MHPSLQVPSGQKLCVIKLNGLVPYSGMRYTAQGTVLACSPCPIPRGKCCRRGHAPRQPRVVVGVDVADPDQAQAGQHSARGRAVAPHQLPVRALPAVQQQAALDPTLPSQPLLLQPSHPALCHTYAHRT